MYSQFSFTNIHIKIYHLDGILMKHTSKITYEYLSLKEIILQVKVSLP